MVQVINVTTGRDRCCLWRICCCERIRICKEYPSPGNIARFWRGFIPLQDEPLGRLLMLWSFLHERYRVRMTFNKTKLQSTLAKLNYTWNHLPDYDAKCKLCCAHLAFIDARIDDMVLVRMFGKSYGDSANSPMVQCSLRCSPKRTNNSTNYPYIYRTNIDNMHLWSLLKILLRETAFMATSEKEKKNNKKEMKIKTNMSVSTATSTALVRLNVTSRIASQEYFVVTMTVQMSNWERWSRRKLLNRKGTWY